MMNDIEADRQRSHDGTEAAVAEFIRRKGITRCPTACAVATQGEVAEADRAALAEYATGRERSRQAKAVRRINPFWLIEPRRPDRR